MLTCPIWNCQYHTKSHTQVSVTRYTSPSTLPKNLSMFHKILFSFGSSYSPTRNVLSCVFTPLGNLLDKEMSWWPLFLNSILASLVCGFERNKAAIVVHLWLHILIIHSNFVWNNWLWKEASYIKKWKYQWPCEYYELLLLFLLLQTWIWKLSPSNCQDVPDN